MNNRHQDSRSLGRRSPGYLLGQWVAGLLYMPERRTIRALRVDFCALLAWLASLLGLLLARGILFAILLPIAGILFAAAFLMIGGPIVVMRQAIGWLQTGIWSPMEFRLAWHALGGVKPDMPHWRGVQKVLVWFLDQPLSFGLFVCGILVFVAILMIVLEYERLFERQKIET